MKSYNQKIKLYGEFGSKISTFNYAIKNVEEDIDKIFSDSFPTPKRSYSKSDDPITRNDSIKRSIDHIFDICILNEFTHFVTFTFNDKIINGYDYNECLRKIRRWYNNQVQNTYIERYIFVPELHPTSKRIHFHSLTYFNDTSKLIDSGHIDLHNRIVYNVSSWKNGFTTAVNLDSNKLGVAIYITKYITKELTNFVLDERITKRFYYAGGNIVLTPPTYYNNANYDSAAGNEINILFRGEDSPFKVKYDFTNKDTGENYAYFEDITYFDIDF